MFNYNNETFFYPFQKKNSIIFATKSTNQKRISLLFNLYDIYLKESLKKPTFFNIFFLFKEIIKLKPNKKKKLAIEIKFSNK